jgi:hypothetical protein
MAVLTGSALPASWPISAAMPLMAASLLSFAGQGGGAGVVDAAGPGHGRVLEGPGAGPAEERYPDGRSSGGPLGVSPGAEFGDCRYCPTHRRYSLIASACCLSRAAASRPVTILILNLIFIPEGRSSSFTL